MPTQFSSEYFLTLTSYLLLSLYFKMTINYILNFTDTSVEEHVSDDGRPLLYLQRVSTEDNLLAVDAARINTEERPGGYQ